MRRSLASCRVPTYLAAAHTAGAGRSEPASSTRARGPHLFPLRDHNPTEIRPIFTLAVGGLFLWVFGNNIEDSMGHVRFVVFYLLTGIVAALSQVALDPGSVIPMVGASGAVSGIMGAYLLWLAHDELDHGGWW